MKEPMVELRKKPSGALGGANRMGMVDVDGLIPRIEDIDSPPYYRMDFRGPEIINHTGFQGSDKIWNNTIFGNETVYASRSLRGTSRYAMEALMGLKASGGGAYKELSKRDDFKDRRVHVYEINASSLEVIDLKKDFYGGAEPSFSNFNQSSVVLKYRSEHENRTDEEDIFFLTLALNRYYNEHARDTEEVIIRGPIPPTRIRFYKSL